MRVIAGSAKGRRLSSVPGTGTRPITDRVKESLFNILGDSVPASRFLDLFAGTGSVGIEALSRGAESAVFIERNPRAIAVIHKNLRATGLAPSAEVVRGDVYRYLERACRGPFDLVYVAPPQYAGLWARTVLILDRTTCLAPQGQIIAQIHPKEYEPQDLSTLEVSDQRQYGSTSLIFYRHVDEDVAEGIC